jgi:O-antigen/teichoic acid export membrane protein
MNNQSTINKKSLKASFAYVLGAFLPKLLSLLITPIVTRVLTVYDFGVVSSYNSFISFFLIIFTFDISYTVLVAKKDFIYKDFQLYIRNISIFSSIVLLFFYIIYKILSISFIINLGIPIFLYDFIFFQSILMNINTILQTFRRSIFNYKSFFLQSLLLGIFSPLIILIFIQYNTDNLYFYYILGNIIPLIFIFVFNIKVLFKFKGLFLINHIKYALVISLPLMIHHIAMNILANFDRVLIPILLDNQSNGIYSLAYTYSSIISLLLFSFNGAWQPWFNETFKNYKINDIYFFSKKYIHFFSFSTLSAILFTSEVIDFLGPTEYADAKKIAPIIIIGIYFQFLATFYINKYYFYKKNILILKHSVLSATINITLNILLLPKFGYFISSGITLISYFIMFLFYFINSFKKNELNLFPKKNILIHSSFLLTFTFIIVIFNISFFFRVTIFVFFFISFFLQNLPLLLSQFKDFKKLLNFP